MAGRQSWGIAASLLIGCSPDPAPLFVEIPDQARSAIIIPAGAPPSDGQALELSGVPVVFKDFAIDEDVDVLFYDRTLGELDLPAGPLVSDGQCAARPLPRPLEALRVNRGTMSVEPGSERPASLDAFRYPMAQLSIAGPVIYRETALNNQNPILLDDALLMPTASGYRRIELDAPEVVPTTTVALPGVDGIIKAHYEAEGGWTYFGTAEGELLCGTYESGFTKIFEVPEFPIVDIKRVERAGVFTIAIATVARFDESGAIDVARVVWMEGAAPGCDLTARMAVVPEGPYRSANDSALAPLPDGSLVTVLDGGYAYHLRLDAAPVEIELPFREPRAAPVWVPGLGVALIARVKSFAPELVMYDPDVQAFAWGNVLGASASLEGALVGPPGTILGILRTGQLRLFPLPFGEPSGEVIAGCLAGRNAFQTGDVSGWLQNDRAFVLYQFELTETGGSVFTVAIFSIE